MPRTHEKFCVLTETHRGPCKGQCTAVPNTPHWRGRCYKPEAVPGSHRCAVHAKMEPPFITIAPRKEG